MSRNGQRDMQEIHLSHNSVNVGSLAATMRAGKAVSFYLCSARACNSIPSLCLVN